MKKDEIIALLQQQISFLQEQLQEANRKADALLEEVTSLRNTLELKSEEEAKQKRIIKGLAKITENKSLTTASVYRIAMALDMDPRDMFFPTDEEETELSFLEKERLKRQKIAK